MQCFMVCILCRPVLLLGNTVTESMIAALGVAELNCGRQNKYNYYNLQQGQNVDHGAGLTRALCQWLKNDDIPVGEIDVGINKDID